MSLQRVRPREPDHLLNIGEVCARTNLKKRTIKYLVSTGKFPRPKKLGERLRYWVSDDVTKWLAAQGAQP